MWCRVKQTIRAPPGPVVGSEEEADGRRDAHFDTQPSLRRTVLTRSLSRRASSSVEEITPISGVSQALFVERLCDDLSTLGSVPGSVGVPHREKARDEVSLALDVSTAGRCEE